jgi:hypothetical protein
MILLPFFLRPFRCLSCHRRFYRPLWFRSYQPSVRPAIGRAKAVPAADHPIILEQELPHEQGLPGQG